MKADKAWILFAFATVLIFIKLCFNTVEPDNLMWELENHSSWDLMNHKSAYLCLIGISFFSVFIFSFGPFGSYYKFWSAVLPSIIFVSIPFLLWDALFTYWEVWGFQHDYTMDWYLFKMPLEEYLFFLTVPFACMYIYYMVNRWFIKNRKASKIEKTWSVAFASFLLIFGILKWEHMYTSTTFLLSATLLFLHILYGDSTYRSNFWISFAICLIPFLFINGFLTGSWMAKPIVVYNPMEYFGTRIGTIPLDDFIYCFLMLFSITILTEKQLQKQLKGFF